jgi:hypothetical protein
MIFKCFSIFDSKIGSYSKPVFLRSKGEAIRAVTSEVQSKESELSKYPADFTLFEVGEYDDDTGTMIPAAANISIGCCIEFVLKLEK